MTNKNGRFGIHGGQYIPETLMNAVIELEQAYDHFKNDAEFNRELAELFNGYAGRPSLLYFAKKLTENDDLESIVQSYKARPDSEIYFPSQWVRKRGNKKVYFGWAY